MSVFLSTLSLRRATGSTARARKEPLFLSTLSLRRATPVTDQDGQTVTFLSTLSLRRATCDTLSALAPKQFLSTLSLRRATTDDRKRNEKVKFLSTLSLRRATHRTDAKSPQQGISIHALLAESDCYSLRHSASCRYFYPRSPCGERHEEIKGESDQNDFYPRSPCGERRYLINTYHRIFGISIHALLAESDLYTLTRCASQRLFLSTLSLRRATL